MGTDFSNSLKKFKLVFLGEQSGKSFWFRNSRLEVFCRIVLIKISQNSQEHRWHRCFLVNSAEVLSAPILRNMFERLFLVVYIFCYLCIVFIFFQILLDCRTNPANIYLFKVNNFSPFFLVFLLLALNKQMIARNLSCRCIF